MCKVDEDFAWASSAMEKSTFNRTTKETLRKATEKKDGLCLFFLPNKNTTEHSTLASPVSLAQDFRIPSRMVKAAGGEWTTNTISGEPWSIGRFGCNQ